MNDLLAAHGITEGNILQFLAVRLTYQALVTWCSIQFYANAMGLGVY